MIVHIGPETLHTGSAAPGPRPVQPALNESPLARLRSVCARAELDVLAGELDRLLLVLDRDLLSFEAELASVRGEPTVVGKSAAHLLALGGKRLRPLLVVLGARLGSGFTAEAMHLAIAVELVHSATLLHDDVVDLGTMRRGALAARALYGNAASIFAGDWLLIEALRRVRASRVKGALDRLLSVIEEMISAEAIQLERRGRIDPSREAYFDISKGKTASLFRWAMFAGARAGGVPEDALFALDAFALDLGVAFQAIDDALDLGTDTSAVKKSLGVDLREGKMTYPLIVGLERDQSGELAATLREIVAQDASEESLPDALRDRVLAKLREVGALEATVALAKERAGRARERLDPIPPGPTKAMLEIIAETMVHRTF